MKLLLTLILVLGLSANLFSMESESTEEGECTNPDLCENGNPKKRAPKPTSSGKTRQIAKPNPSPQPKPSCMESESCDE